MRKEDALLYGVAVHETVEILVRDGKIEDRKLRELMRQRFGGRRGRDFVDRMIVKGVFETDPIGTRLYFQLIGTRDRR